MPRRNTNLNNACIKDKISRCVKRSNESEEQIAARNADQRIRTEIRRQASREQRDERLRQNISRTKAARERHIAAFRERDRERQQTSPALTLASFVRLAFEYAQDIDYSVHLKLQLVRWAKFVNIAKR